MIKRFFLLFFVINLLIFPYPQEKWKGKFFKEGDVTVVENRGEGIWGRNIGEKILLKENLSLGVEYGDENQIFGWIDVAVDSSQNIYIPDQQNHRILKFDKNGKFIWKAGREGQGPGEFQYPDRIRITNDGKLAVSDDRAIHFCDSKGNYLKTSKLGKYLNNFEFLKDGRVLISYLPKGQAGWSAEFYSKDLKPLKKFPDEYFYGPKFSPNLGAGVGEGFTLSRDKIFLCLPDRYEIREYDIEGKTLRKIRRDLHLRPPEIKITGGCSGISIRGRDSCGPSFILRNGMIVNFLRIFGENKKESFLDFYSEEGKFLGSIKIEDDSLILVDENDNFYFILSEPFTKLIRKSITFR